MFQVHGMTVMTAEEFDEKFGGLVNPFAAHAANLVDLADAIDAGMKKIATGSQIPDGFTTDDVPVSLLDSEMGLAEAGKLFVAALRTQAADWRKAGAGK